jgi:Tol biopolymer transport system component
MRMGADLLSCIGVLLFTGVVMSRVLGGFTVVVPFVLCLAGCTRTQQVGGTPGNAARARGAVGLTQLTEAPATRRLWKGPSVDFEGRPSPDGRFVSTTDWNTGDLGLRDLAADTTRRVTAKGSWATSSDFAEGSAISADGKTVAFGWFSTDIARFELRAMPISGPDSGKMRTIYTAPGLEFVSPQSFTPDGQSIAAVINRNDRTTQIALIPLAGGAPKILKTFDWRTPNDLAVSPDGRWLAYDFPLELNDPARDVYVVALDGSRETAVLQDKGNDVVAGWSRDGAYLVVSSERGGTPGVWALPMTTGKTQGEPVLVRADLWRMVPMGTSADGSIFYGVQTGQRDIYTAAFDSKTGKLVSQPTSVSGGTFNASPYTAAFSPDGQNVAYVVSRGSSVNLYGPADVVIRSVERGEMRRLSPNLSRITRVYWLPDGRSLLVRGADQKGRAGLYKVALGSGAVSPVYQTSAFMANAVAITRDGSRAFFVTQDSTGTCVNALDLAKGSTRIVYTASRGSLFSGIAVSPDGMRVALALRPNVREASTILLLAADGGAVRELHRLPLSDDVVPYTGLAWSGDGRDIYFGASTRTPQVAVPSTEIRRIPADGGEAQVVGVKRGPVTIFQISSDGRRIVYGVSDFDGEVWVMAPPKFSAATKVAGSR